MACPLHDETGDAHRVEVPTQGARRAAPRGREHHAAIETDAARGVWKSAIPHAVDIGSGIDDRAATLDGIK
jgi:hypothetical protein